MTTTAVVFAFDEAYSLPAFVAITSVAQRGDIGTTPLIALDCGLSRMSVSALRRLGDNLGMDLRVRDASGALSAVRDFPTSEYVSTAAWVRLHIAHLCSDFNRALYLDADTLCRASVRPLLGSDLGPHVLGAVRDVFHPTLGTPVCLPGLDLERCVARRPYLNAGVLLIDIQRWISSRLTEELVQFVKNHPHYLRFRDQDALNGVLLGDWRELDASWNMPPVMEIVNVLRFGYFGSPFLPRRDFRRAQQSARIMHYLTELKPWRARFPQGNARREFEWLWAVTRGLLGGSGMTQHRILEFESLRTSPATDAG